MKQVLQNARSGAVTVEEVPAPVLQPGRVLVRTAASVISAGTEKTAIDSGKKSLLAKAKERPDLVKKVIARVRSDGVAAAYSAVQAKLDSSTALGYSSAGIIAAVGEGVDDLRPGDRVSCAGLGYASHAEILSVPRNLCVRIPENISFEEAAFGTLGAIALQGVRLAGPTLGESIVVIGLGLLGQLTVQLLRANGCRVLGVDIDESKFDMTLRHGAEKCASPATAADLAFSFTRGRGADAVLITAGTPSSDPVALAGEVSRLKGRVVAVGLVGMDIPRDVYFRKELSFQVSMSYGPGRYDAEYEERGHDYPFAYVRWTEGRNVEAFLDLIAAETINVKPLITHRFPVEQATDAYRLLSGDVKDPYLGIILTYDPEKEIIQTAATPVGRKGKSTIRVGLIGAGDYAKAMLLPHFERQGVEFCAISTASGVTATSVARQFGFAHAVSSPHDVFHEDVDLVVIATRHDSHAELATRALEAGLNAFVEKPLALNDEELGGVLAAARSSDGLLMVGYNRRFSPAARAGKLFFDDHEGPLSISYRINAGRVPPESWIQDPTHGGGRIVGEVCHFVDLVQYMTSSRVVRVFAEAISSRDERVTEQDSVVVTLKLADGSNAAIAYLAEGDNSLAKERIELFGRGRTFLIDDFRSHTEYAGGKSATTKLSKQDKGQAGQIEEVCSVVRSGGEAPISLDSLENTSLTTFRILESLRTGQVRYISPADDPHHSLENED